MNSWPTRTLVESNLRQISSLRARRKLLKCTTIIAGALIATVPSLTAIAHAEGQNEVVLPVAPNTEDVTSSVASGGDLGFSISVDGEAIAGDALTQPAASRKALQRQADVGLEHVDIQVKFDGLEIEPILNVSTVDTRRTYQAGESVEFATSSNYPSWIARSEIRIYVRGGDNDGALVSKIPVGANDTTTWTMPSTETEDEYRYVLRVYDHRDRYDETNPLSIARTSRAIERQQTSDDQIAIAAGNGEDRTAFRNIPVYGGAVTVYGRHVPVGSEVVALGETIPVDGNNSFVVQRILPPGDHTVDVSVDGVKDAGLNFDREITIPANDLFYVGLVDVTVGKRFGDAELVAANPGEYEGIYTRGRLAFYLKGKVKGRYLITAAADTGEAELENLFTDFDAKNPRQLLRRIDPDKYYPVYGDDSTIEEDAPTSGKFYVKIEHGDSHVMWGNFKSTIKGGGTYLRSERTLYGAQARYRSEATTSFGERKIEAELYAAQPGTLPQRDVLQGTGGSAYFLKRQDVSIGSETVSVELRDPVTGRVIETLRLTEGKDYTIDYIQGVIILSRPISSTVSTGGVVRDSLLGDDALRLIVQYEYTPTAGDVDGYSLGGRAQAWLGDKVRVGVTGMREKTDSTLTNADQEMIGADIRFRHSDTTYLHAEFAQTKGPGFGNSISTDGGLTIVDQTSAGIANRIATAWRVSGQVDLQDITAGDIKGKLGAYYEKKQAGFSTLDHNVTTDQVVWGVYGEIEPSKEFKLSATYEDYSDAGNVSRKQATVDANWQVNQYWKLTLGAKYSDIRDPSAADDKTGTRTDLAAQVTYSPDEDREFYAFAQGTVQTTGGRGRNDRGGVGAKIRLNDKVGLEGEVSYGTTGWGAIAGLTYDPTADEHYYIGYRLDAERNKSGTTLDGTDLGGIVIGAKRRYNDQWSAFSENNYDMFGKRRELTSTYGITYTPDTRWTIDGGLEIGRIQDPNASDFDRKAASIGVSYNDGDKFTARARAEIRLDDSEDDTRDAQSYLFTGGIAYKVNPDWRLIAHVDGLISNSDQGAILDGDYIEGSVGFAYRPVENDKLNALFKYTYLQDLPGADQVTVNGSTLGPRQRSHVLSADATYKFNNNISLGGKYGFRIGQVETARGSGIYNESSAHLAILRADLHVVHNWDALIEGRVLWSPSANTTDLGALAAVYRHFGPNMKAGIGYNFGRFSDDLTDLTLDDQGVFFNVIGKF